MVRFLRAVPGGGDPQPDAPDIDERGFKPPFTGPMASLTAGRTVKVGLQRVFVEAATPLFVESSDPSVMRVADPAGGQLPFETQMIIQVTGVDGGSFRRDAQLRVRIGTADGPIIHQLHVVVFTPVVVRVTPHVVTISDQHTAGSAPTADVPAIMKKVADIWTVAGVSFNVQAVRQQQFTFARANSVADTPFPGELATLLADTMPDGSPGWIPNTINVYFVVQIGTRNILGYGFSRSSFAAFHLPNPGIILGDRSAGGPRKNLMHYAQTLAHEFGHFFTLGHAGGAQIPNEREDTWSRRMLMHNFNPIRGHDPFPVNDANGKPFTQRPRFDDVGYGDHAAGCLLTLKDVAGFPGDAECLAARSAIVTPPGPY
jgi:hypothetical protein